jgi:hypothetical protein
MLLSQLGSDLLASMAEAGFESVRAIEYCSRDYGYWGSLRRGGRGAPALESGGKHCRLVTQAEHVDGRARLSSS